MPLALLQFPRMIPLAAVPRRGAVAIRKNETLVQPHIGRNDMSGTLINLIIQLIAGAAGGNAAGATMKNLDLGTLGNTIAGAIGGAGGGTILTALLPMLQGAAGSGDIGTILGQAVGGGVAGAVVTAIVGLIKNMMSGQTAK